MIFHNTPFVIPDLKLRLKHMPLVLNHIEISAFRLPTSILTSGYPTFYYFRPMETCFSFGDQTIDSEVITQYVVLCLELNR